MEEQGQQEAPGPWTRGHKQQQEEERCSPGEPLAPAWGLDYSDYGEPDYGWQSACASLEEVRRSIWRNSVLLRMNPLGFRTIKRICRINSVIFRTFF